MSESTLGHAPAAELSGLARRALAVGIVAAAVALAGAVLDRESFLRSYLVAWLYWLSIAGGCLGTLMLHHMTRGAWGLAIRRPLEAAAGTLPWLALGFLPLLADLGAVFPWADAAHVDELVAHKSWYLNVPFFIARAAVYFAIWTLFAWALTRISKRQEATGDPALSRRAQNVAGPGLGIYGLTATLASVDWLMSLDPHWYSSIFGVYFIGGQAVAAMAFVIAIVYFLSQRPPLDDLLTSQHYHDYGNLLMAFTLLWTYFALSQFLIIWSGNLPEETVWYVARQSGGWKWVSLALVVFHFAVPFFLLLSRARKRRIERLLPIAALLLAMRWVDLYWLAAPAFDTKTTPGWLDPVLFVAIGGLWFAAFARRLSRRALLPLGDPYLEEAVEG